MTLGDFVKEDCILFNKKINNWEEAVNLAGELLLHKGCINDRYIKDMVNLIRELGPYIVVMPGIALAHARPNGNVYKNSISIITVPEGVRFGNKNNDPVYLIFAIAATSDFEHLSLFKTVAEYLGKEERIKKLISAHNYDESGILNY